jgi:hypothetical protein
MSRAKRAAHRFFIEACRTLARFMPPLLLHALLVPYEMIRGVRPALTRRDLPLRHIPPRPDDNAPGFVARWRYQSRKYERWLATLWLELWKRPPWSGRFTVEHSEIIDRLLVDRPVVLVTVHTGWHMASGAWLLNRGLEIGSVILNADNWARAQEMRETDDWKRYEGSNLFLRGDTRSMVRFLTPGRCFMIQVDHPQGKLVDFEWTGGQFQMASGAFRLARLARAVVVPIIALDDGLWRYRVHVGAPVPEDAISSGDDVAAATHVGRELLPLIAQSPDQLMGTNVLRGYIAGYGPSETRSGLGRDLPKDEALSHR